MASDKRKNMENHKAHDPGAARRLHTTHPQVRALARILQAKGIRDIVLSSGSRNAPIVQELTSDPGFRCFSIVDERSAAFFALGLAKQQSQPAVVVCTSGSAVLNYYPAVAEAYYSRVPMIVISADRPAQWIDQAVGQTIRQDQVLAAHSVYNASLREGSDEQTAWYNARKINRAVNAARRECAPVHLNIPLSEPLYRTTDSDSLLPAPRIIEQMPVEHVPAPETVEEIRRLWKNAARKMILVGAGQPNERLSEVLSRLARQSDTVVLCETTSNLLSGNDASGCPDPFIRHIDRTLRPFDPCDERTKRLQPDLLITCAGMVVSKKIKTFLQEAAPAVHIHVDPHTHPDTYMSLTHCVSMDAAAFFSLLEDSAYNDTGYARLWAEKNAESQAGHRIYCQNAPYSDFKVWETLLDTLPQDSHLEIANSAAIRYSQLFALPKGVSVSCNRGTSGIDGCGSTAAGAAVALAPRRVTLVSGDLSFLYDNNALWNAYLPASMRFIVLNNGGGGIFRILDGARTSSFSPQYLQASHRIEFQALAQMHDLEYRRANDLESLRQALSDFWAPSSRPILLEADTRTAENDTVLRGYFAALGDD